MVGHQFSYLGWDINGDCYHLYLSNRYDFAHLKGFLENNKNLVKVLCICKEQGFINQILK